MGGDDARPHPAGFDRRVLGGVADRPHGRASLVHVVDESGVLSVAEGGGLVDDHDRATGENLVGSGVEPRHQSSDCSGRDTSGPLEDLSRSAVDRGPDHFVAGGLPGAGSDLERRGLA